MYKIRKNLKNSIIKQTICYYTNNKTAKSLFLSFIEAWERFSYYGMRALLVLFLLTKLSLNDSQSYAIYSIFCAICYAVPFISGHIADNYLGFKRTTIIGGFIMCIGYAIMVIAGINSSIFYLGLATVATGTGFFKGNITNLLGSIYSSADPEREKAFTWFYVAVNLGSAVASIACAYVADIYGYEYGFALAGIGMILGMIIFILGGGIIEGIGEFPNAVINRDNNAKNKDFSIEGDVYSVSDFSPIEECNNEEKIVEIAQKKYVVGIKNWIYSFFTLLLVIICSFLTIVNSEAVKNYTWIPGLVGIFLFVKLILKLQGIDRTNMLLLVILIMTLMFFFALEMQLGSVINVFTMRNVNTNVFGYTIPPASLQSLNPLTIIFLGAFFANIFQRFGAEFSLKRVLIGLIATALGVWVMLLGCRMADAGQVGLIYLVVSMVLIAFTEICLGPVIQSLCASIPPIDVRGFVMGILMLGLSYSNLAGIVISKFVAVQEGNVDDKISSLAIYDSAFMKAGLFCTVLCFAFAALILWMQKVLNKYLENSRRYEN